MAKLIFASKNEGKVREFREFLTPLGIEVVSLNELDNVPAIIEDGTTFQENATIKAETIAHAFGVPVPRRTSFVCILSLFLFFFCFCFCL